MSPIRSHRGRARAVVRWTKLLACSHALWLSLGACASSGHTVRASTYAAGSVSHGSLQDAPLHGFDPREYYDRHAISTQRGEASYYANRFAGRLTANGERYDPDAYTAAHRSLPFGSIVRVVREPAGDWVLVRINDRGPYAKGRIIDLSRQAAERLSMIREGVVRVRLELLKRGAGKYVRTPKRKGH